jgi:hypothetical protein
MAATITAKLNLDASGFTAALTRAQASLGRIKAIGVPVLAAGFAAASAAAVGLAAGIKSAIDIGGQLSDLSTRTGVAAGELRVLQEAFARNGLEAGQVGPVINKLQKAIVEAGEGTGPVAQAFARLGINMDELAGMSSAQQLDAIGQAIAALPDPAARAATAMQIFGRSGGELLTLFANSGAMGQAASAVGDQADLLTRNANLFDEASDILGQVGTKMQGFFVGVADQLIPALMPLLEALDQVDLAGIGQGLGEGIAFALTAITSGQVGNLLALQLRIAGGEFVNLLVSGVQGMVAFLAQRMVDIPKDFVTFLKEGLPAAAMKFAAIINRVAASLLEAIAQVPGLGRAGNMAGGLRQTADGLDAAAAAPMANMAGRMAESLAAAMEKASQAMAATGQTVDTSGLTAARDQILAGIVNQMEATRSEMQTKYGGTKTSFGSPLDLDSATRGRNTGILAQSLQRVGGGAAFARFSDAANPAAAAVREQKTSNALLGKILDKITPGPPVLMGD